MAKERILVVEDEGIVAKDIETSLKDLGYTVVSVVSTGREALRKIAENPCDLVLMDIMLKGDADGLQTAEQIRDLHGTPVVYLTAYADDRTLERAKITEPFGYVLKPFEENALRTAIEMALYRHKLETRLRESEEWLATILRYIGDGVIATDARGRVIFMNPAAERLTGFKHGGAMAKDVSAVLALVDERTREPISYPVQLPPANGPAAGGNASYAWERHGILAKPGGGETPIDASASPLSDDKGNVRGSVLVFRDMSDRKRLEAEMLKASKLESVGILAGGIAHDFNNFLTGIIGNVSLARITLPANERGMEFLSQAERACWRARELTQQLLTFSKGGVPAKETVQIADIIKDAAEFALHGAVVRCEYNFAYELWPVEVDTGQIGQVVNNMVMNSVEAMPEGGMIRVQVSNLILGAGSGVPLAPGKYVVIRIADEGTGIRPEHLGRVFDPYFTTKQKGSGLGLATSYSIITKHGGHIAVDSELGIGTTFAIYLPASPDKVPQKPEPVSVPKRGKGRILVMDDEPVIRDAAGAMLAHLGYDVSAAEDGSRAIELYRKAAREGAAFDAVIMDLTVRGGMGGKEAAKQILDVYPTARIIASSGYSNEPVMAEFHKYGFSATVAKPYDMAILGDALHRLLNGRG